jgi:glycosyltransferase involved in cell wall biosynthesis
VVVSTNCSEQKGGEAIKALQFYKQLKNASRNVHVITHERNKAELLNLFGATDFTFVEDTPLQKILWKLRAPDFFLDAVFHLKAASLLRHSRYDRNSMIVHYLCPVSPVTPRFPPSGMRFVIGPLTGNIYYPPAFRDREPLSSRMRRLFHSLIQRVSRWIFNDKKNAEVILVSGGERTRSSIALAGGRLERMIDVVDAGITDSICQRAAMQHAGELHRFVCAGRLVSYKAVDLAIKAVASADSRVHLDIIGQGAHENELRKLAAELGLSERVRFLGWMAHAKLLDTYRDYRAFIFPSLAEANGIVMQEAMTIGLPMVCLRWGGPTLLANDRSAIYIEPTGAEQVVKDIALAMNRLGSDPDYANALAQNARTIADRRFSWERAVTEWTAGYTGRQTSAAVTNRSA